MKNQKEDVSLENQQKKSKQKKKGKIAEVLSDGTYHYSDFRDCWDINGPCTCVFNITSKHNGQEMICSPILFLCLSSFL